jgi:hypothetical protein
MRITVLKQSLQTSCSSKTELSTISEDAKTLEGDERSIWDA